MSDGITEAWKYQKKLQMLEKLYETNEEYKNLCDRVKELKNFINSAHNEIIECENKANKIIKNYEQNK